MSTWVTYLQDDARRSGVLADGSVYHLGDGRSLDHMLRVADPKTELRDAAIRAMESVPVPVQDVRLLAPIEPRAIRDLMGFHQHIRNCLGGELPERHREVPIYYFSNPGAVIGPEDDVRMAPSTTEFDFELEVAAVIGRNATNVAPHVADDYIVGYMMLIDWSSRDLQRSENDCGLGPVKGKDTATTLGPTFVTADELEGVRRGKGFDLAMRVHLNGELYTDGNLDTISWSFADMLAYASRGTTVQSGDVLGSGTVGEGCLLEHFLAKTGRFKRWLQPGDVVEFEVEKLGRIRQVVRESLPLIPLSSGH